MRSAAPRSLLSAGRSRAGQCSTWLLALLLPCLLQACATRKLTVSLEQAPEYLIPGGRGVAAWDTVVERQERDPAAPGAAAQLSARMRQALSKKGNRFHLVAVDDLGQVDGYLQRTGGRLDTIDPGQLEDFLVRTYGKDIPAVAFFKGTLIDVRRGEEDGRYDPLIGAPYLTRDAYVELDWGVEFLELGSKKRTYRILEARAEDATRCAEGEKLPAIDYDRLVRECVTQLVDEFELLWTPRTSPKPIPIFVDDGVLYLFWEKHEPEFSSGLASMRRGDYGEAQAEYERLVQRAEESGGQVFARALYDLGLACELQGDLDTALEHYSRSDSVEHDSRVRKRRAACEERIRVRDATRRPQPSGS